MLQVLLWLPCHNVRGGRTGGAALVPHSDRPHCHPMNALSPEDPSVS